MDSWKAYNHKVASYSAKMAGHFIFIFWCSLIGLCCGNINPMKMVLNEANVDDIDDVGRKEYIELKSFAIPSKQSLQGYVLGKLLINNIMS